MLALDICNRNEDKEYRISDKFKIKKTVFKCTHTFSNNADVEHYDKKHHKSCLQYNYLKTIFASPEKVNFIRRTPKIR